MDTKESKYENKYNSSFCEEKKQADPLAIPILTRQHSSERETNEYVWGNLPINEEQRTELLDELINEIKKNIID